MRADYDSEADALDIELFRFEHFEYQETVHDSYCQVGLPGAAWRLSSFYAPPNICSF